MFYDDVEFWLILCFILCVGCEKYSSGTTLPAFLSPNVAKVLVEAFGIAGITTVDEDIELFLK